jgi:hypothetical protein
MLVSVDGCSSMWMDARQLWMDACRPASVSQKRSRNISMPRKAYVHPAVGVEMHIVATKKNNFLRRAYLSLTFRRRFYQHLLANIDECKGKLQ